MEKHLKYLENICRTCGGKIKERKKLVLLYMKEINRLFGYDISIDVNNEHILKETALMLPISICLIANIFMNSTYNSK